MRAILVSLVGSALLAGCRDAPFSPKVLTLAATVVPSPLRGGDTITVVVSVTNKMLFSVQVGGGPCPLEFGFEIVDQSGAAVGGIPEGCVLRGLNSGVIQPGETVSQAFRWVAVDSGGAPLAPGSYDVRGDCSWVPGVKSPPQPFVVTP